MATREHSGAESRLEPAAAPWGLLRSLFVTAPLIILATIALGSISLAGAFLGRRGPFQQRCSRAWSRVILFFSGVRVEAAGLGHLRRSGPYVICANHQSYMDIPVLLAVLPIEFRFAAKKELFRVPFLGWHLRQAGHVRIDRERPVSAVRALEAAAARVRRGLSIVIFPEGRTSRDGAVGPFKGGAFLVAARSGAALVPVTIRGTRGILPAGSSQIRPGQVMVTVDAPIPSTVMSEEAASAAVRRVIVDRLSQPWSGKGAGS